MKKNGIIRALHSSLAQLFILGGGITPEASDQCYFQGNVHTVYMVMKFEAKVLCHVLQSAHCFLPIDSYFHFMNYFIKVRN